MSSFPLLWVTERALCREPFLDRVAAVAAAQPAGVLLREKDLSEEDYRLLAQSVQRICRRYGVPFLAHSHPKVALELQADALHLPLPVLRALSGEERRGLPRLGVSCHSVAEAVEAWQLGADYLTAGHVFDTTCKAGLPGRGLDFLAAVCGAVPLPVYAIGGVHPAAVPALRRAGAAGGCVRAPLTTCPSPTDYLHQWKECSAMNLTPQQLRLYAVTDRAWTGRQTLLEQLEDALKGGVTLVQLREKNLPQEDFLAEALAAKELCHRYGVPLLINDDVDLALQCGADGVHVGAEDRPVAEIRRLAGPDFLIGATAKTVAQAQAAQADGADYIGVGAVFPSPTKPNAVGITKEELAAICASVTIPAVAIGGITRDNLPQLSGCGAVGAAVVSALFGAPDIRAAAQELHDLTLRVFP